MSYSSAQAKIRILLQFFNFLSMFAIELFFYFYTKKLLTNWRTASKNKIPLRGSRGAANRKKPKTKCGHNGTF